MNDLKNMLILKDLPSNIIEEAYIVLNPNLKLKIQELEAKNSETETDKKISKNYILDEAKYVLLNYISKYETKIEKNNTKILEEKYKKLKKITVSMLLLFLVYVLITSII